jgi:hypothetical protein
MFLLEQQQRSRRCRLARASASSSDAPHATAVGATAPLPAQVPWENQNMHCIVTVYGCAVNIDNKELD